MGATRWKDGRPVMPADADVILPPPVPPSAPPPAGGAPRPVGRARPAPARRAPQPGRRTRSPKVASALAAAVVGAIITANVAHVGGSSSDSTDPVPTPTFSLPSLSFGTVAVGSPAYVLDPDAESAAVTVESVTPARATDGRTVTVVHLTISPAGPFTTDPDDFRLVDPMQQTTAPLATVPAGVRATPLTARTVDGQDVRADLVFAGRYDSGTVVYDSGTAPTTWTF